MTDTITDLDAMDRAVARFIELAAQVGDLLDEQSQIKAQLRALGIGEHPTRLGVVVNVTPTRRFNAGHAREILPPELLALCMAEVVDSQTAKKALPPNLYDACMLDVGEPTVRIS